MILSHNTAEVLLNSSIGFEVEFNSNYDIETTATLLARELNKPIHIETQAHAAEKGLSQFKPSAHHFKLEPDFSGGVKLVELVTGPQPYQDARLTLIKILKWVQNNGTTNDKCSIHINLNFGDYLPSLANINILKLILEFDEEYIYKLFPNRKGSVYARSIKHIIPNEKYHFDDISTITPHHFIFPGSPRGSHYTKHTNKYFGINFQKLEKNYLELRYIGGEGYENKITDILDLIDFFIKEIYNSAKDRNFTEENKLQLRKILNKHKGLVNAYRSYEGFCKSYPELGLLVDLDTDIRRINLYWGKIRDQVYNILAQTGIQSGAINYDSNTSRIQIQGADMSKSFYVSGIDIIDSKLGGIVENCDIFESEVSEAEIYVSNLFNNSLALHCKLFDSYVNRSCTLERCYVYGKSGVMSGTMIDGIFREGKITSFSNFEGTEVIEYEKIKTPNHVKY